ncbi:MAG: hypothetical protein NTV86_21835 [Planctomycetota bacterium]|nr:hypothetical protein [Planctomycetota bacterium]
MKGMNSIGLVTLLGLAFVATSCKGKQDAGESQPTSQAATAQTQPASRPDMARTQPTSQPDTSGAGGREEPGCVAVPPNTVVTPYLEREMEPGKNMLWCSTFQMAWDKLADLGGGRLETSPGCIAVSRLNQEKARPGDIPVTGAYSAAGRVGDGSVEGMRARLREMQQAGEARKSILLPASAALPADAVVFYAYLRRSVRFQTPFEVLSAMPFCRSERNVAFFGIQDYSPSSQLKRALAAQVRVVWHRFPPEHKREEGEEAAGPAEPEYIVELLAGQGQDRLVLAKVAPSPTLGKTVEGVMAHLRRPNEKTAKDGIAPEVRQFCELMESEEADVREPKQRPLLEAISGYACLLHEESVRVPRMRCDVVETFKELVGQVIVSGNEKVRNKPIAEAWQRIRFVFDEKGAELESEAGGGVFGSSAMRDFTFSGPFLVLLIRPGAQLPYCALWVANSELLEPGE